MTEQDLGKLRLPKPGIDTEQGELSEEEIVANLRCVDTATITPEEAAELEGGVRAFLESLSDQSFRMRFGRPKPDDPHGYDNIVQTFLYNSAYPPEVVTLVHEDELIGACSIFRHQLRAKPGGDIVDTEHVVELSLTIADKYQRRGVGTTLLEAASRLAAEPDTIQTEDGEKTIPGAAYAYCSFEADNEASRKLIRSVLGSANLVAGATNPRDKYYRLPTDPNQPLDFDPAELERYMHVMCDDPVPEVMDTNENETLRTSQLRKYGRRALRALRHLTSPRD